MRTLHVFIVASLAGTLLACGQKGPLVLPDAQHPHKKIGIGKPPAPPPSAPSAPASPAPTDPASAPNAAPTDATTTGEAQTRPAPAPQP
jgi:predicted small lipoprotein YifL